MSKISKLFRKPRLFFFDAVKQRFDAHDMNNELKKADDANLAKFAKDQVKTAIHQNDVFQFKQSGELKKHLGGGKPVYLYQPWIFHHGDVLISELSSNDSFKILPFNIFSGDIHDVTKRRQVSKYIRENPDVYLRLVLAHLIPVRKQVAGFILTFDWAPVMRLIVQACRILEIPTILIPHESVFANREKYYLDITAKASTPQVDYILGWGELHREIFASRGFDVKNRFKSVGAVKFDKYSNFDSNLSRVQFSQIFGLDPNKKICLFAAQPLDSQYSVKVARDSQRQAIMDVHQKCLVAGAQLLLRLPPSGDNILNADLRKILQLNRISAIDGNPNYLVSPEEAVHHCDATLSMNSTMLFEAILMDRPSITIKYTDFDPIWEPLGVPSVQNEGQLSNAIDDSLSGRWKVDECGMQWATKAFGIGKFDGRATERISNTLVTWAANKAVSKNISPLEAFLNDEPIDVVAIPSSIAVQSTLQKNLKSFVNAQTVISSHQNSKNLNLINLSSVDVFLQWGLQPTLSKNKQSDIAKKMLRPVIFLEDGFIRSFDIGLAGDPTYSIIVDDIAPYYDARKENRLQFLLNQPSDLDKNALERCTKLIKKIVSEKISKYNHAPVSKINIGTPKTPKILLVDQRFGDKSVEFGLASEKTFEKMLFEAVTKYPEHEIIIKLHPDSTRGGKANYFNEKLLSKFSAYKNIFKIGFEINPYSLFDSVDKVFVCTSGVGFEALMAGKEVFCFGAPFYSNRGLTTDYQKIQHRTKEASLEQIFYHAYIHLSRYVNPDTGARCQLEDLIDVFKQKS